MVRDKTTNNHSRTLHPGLNGITFPEYNAFAMGCGLEDRDIHNRYQAMEYGWEEAMKQAEDIINALKEQNKEDV